MIEYGKASEIQKARAVEIGLLIVGLEQKKTAVANDRADHEAIWRQQENETNAEKNKLLGELNLIGLSLVTEK